MTKVYLAGPVQYPDDGGHGWRDFITEKVDEFEFLNPLDKYDVHANDVEMGVDITIEELVEEDKRMVDESDAVLVGWTRVPSVGTPMEVLYAYERDIPVVVWYEPEGSNTNLSAVEFSPWLIYHTEMIVGSPKAALDGLRRLTS